MLHKYLLATKLGSVGNIWNMVLQKCDWFKKMNSRIHILKYVMFFERLSIFLGMFLSFQKFLTPLLELAFKLIAYLKQYLYNMCMHMYIDIYLILKISQKLFGTKSYECGRRSMWLTFCSSKMMSEKKK